MVAVHGIHDRPSRGRGAQRGENGRDLLPHGVVERRGELLAHVARQVVQPHTAVADAVQQLLRDARRRHVGRVEHAIAVRVERGEQGGAHRAGQRVEIDGAVGVGIQPGEDAGQIFVVDSPVVVCVVGSERRAHVERQIIEVDLTIAIDVELTHQGEEVVNVYPAVAVAVHAAQREAKQSVRHAIMDVDDSVTIVVEATNCCREKLLGRGDRDGVGCRIFAGMLRMRTAHRAQDQEREESSAVVASHGETEKKGRRPSVCSSSRRGSVTSVKRILPPTINQLCFVKL